MSTAFDGSAYRQRVLAALRRRSSLELGDPFFIADLDPAEPAADGDVQAHLARVVAFLQRERNSAKYASLAAELVRRRTEWEGPLLDSASREAARERVLAARRSGDAERLAKVDGYLAAVRERFGGIPSSRVAGLRRLAEAAGVAAADFDARLSQERVIPDSVGGGAEPLAPEVRRQIRERLDELCTLRGGDRVATGSLWALLDLSADADRDQVLAAYEVLADRNRRRPHDREKTVTADLLALARARLVDGDPAAYTAGVLADAAEEIRLAVEEHVVLDGELLTPAYEGLVRQLLASGRGLAVGQARAVVLEVARTLGAAVSTGALVDYVVCTGCGRPEPVDGARVCRYCDTDLYVTCTNCARPTEAAAVVCRYCGNSQRQARQAAQALAAVRRALDGGRPREAADTLAAARGLLAAPGASATPTAGTAEELHTRVQAALAAADAGWRALAEDIEAHRTDAAADGARWLAAAAVDVPGPDGRTAAEVLAELTAHQKAVRRRVEAAEALEPQAREAALAAVLTTAADNREALEALAALPLAPPTELTATARDSAVGLRWQASASIGAVSYRVVRLVDAQGQGPGQEQVRRSLGTTWATELGDAGAPVGVVVRYEVTAISGARTSAPVCTPGVVFVHDVADVHAEQAADGVRLTWRLAGPGDTATVERSVEAGPAAQGQNWRVHAAGGVFLDRTVESDTTYQYRVFVEYTDADGRPARTAGAAVAVRVVSRPPPVLDLTATTSTTTTTVPTTAPASDTAAGPAAAGVAGGAAGGVVEHTTLHWTSVAGAAVRVYAVSGDAGTEVFGPEHSEVDLTGIGGRARLVGTSEQGRLVDPDAVGEVVYVPVTLFGRNDGERPAMRGLVGRPLRHLAVGAVRDLRADDRGDEIVLSFHMPPGITEARVLWRRDGPPIGPDDPEAGRATVTSTSLEIKGGWRLSAPRDGWAYYVACYPLYRSGGDLRTVPAGAEVLARPADHGGAPPPGPPPAPTGVRTPAAGTRLPPPPAVQVPVPVPAPRPASAFPPAPAPRPASVARPATTVDYSVGRPGWWRRTLRVHVRTDGPAPELLLVAKPGTVPPRGVQDGHVLSRLAASPLPEARTVEVPLDGAALPWGVRLVPAADSELASITICHPSDTALLVK